MGKRFNTTTNKAHIGQINIKYLYCLAVVHFHYVEVKTVYPFAWRNEITSLLIKIPPNVNQNLKERKKERLMI